MPSKPRPRLLRGRFQLAFDRAESITSKARGVPRTPGSIVDSLEEAPTMTSRFATGG